METLYQSPRDRDYNGKRYEIGDVIPRGSATCAASCLCTTEGIGRCTGVRPT